jgi:CRP-like cAMP-binding protein
VAHLSRAVKVYSRTGFLLKAIAVCKIVLEIDPAQTEVQSELAALHATRGFTTAEERGTGSAALSLTPGVAPRPPPGSAGVPGGRPTIAVPPEGFSPAAAVARSGPPEVPEWPHLPELHSLSASVGLDAVPLGALVPGAGPTRLGAAEQAASVYEIPLAASEAAQTAKLARATLGHTALFSSLDEPRLLLLIQRVRLRQLAEGQVLFKVGDPPDGLYVVAVGEVAVFATAKGLELEVDRLGEGAFFGETALLTNQRRSVTVRATADCELLVIDRDAIGALLAASPMVLLVLLRFMRDRLVKRMVETSRLLAALTPADRAFLAGRFRFLEVEAGAVLVDQGKLAPGMFIILCGEVEALQGQQRLALLGPERTFGESSLLGHRPSRATLRALKKCFLLLLPLEAFQEVTLTQPQVLKLVPPNADDW